MPKDRLTLWSIPVWILSFGGFAAITYLPAYSFIEEFKGLACFITIIISMVMASKVHREYITVRKENPSRVGFVDSVVFAIAEFLYLTGGYYTPVLLALAYIKGWLDGMAVIVGAVGWAFAVIMNIYKEKED